MGNHVEARFMEPAVIRKRFWASRYVEYVSHEQRAGTLVWPVLPVPNRHETRARRRRTGVGIRSKQTAGSLGRSGWSR